LFTSIRKATIAASVSSVVLRIAIEHALISPASQSRKVRPILGSAFPP